MEAILRAAKRGRIPAEPVVVVSSRPDAAALAVAERMGVETEVVGWAGDRDAHDLAVDAALRRHGVVGDGGLVCLAGFMRILGPRFVSARRNRVMNVHPSLLPAFPGLDAQGQAVRYGAKVSGCTVHFVDEGVDTGPVILQAAVPVAEGDTAEALSMRILDQEHRIYPRAVEMFARGSIRVSGRRVVRA